MVATGIRESDFSMDRARKIHSFPLRSQPSKFCYCPKLHCKPGLERIGETWEVYNCIMMLGGHREKIHPQTASNLDNVTCMEDIIVVM